MPKIIDELARTYRRLEGTEDEYRKKPEERIDYPF
jgi:hypothetical protein